MLPKICQMGYVERYVRWSNFSRENQAKSIWPGMDQHQIPSVSPDDLNVGSVSYNIVAEQSSFIFAGAGRAAVERWQDPQQN